MRRREAHASLAVAQEDGGALAAEGRENGLDRRLVHLAERFRPSPAFNKPVQCRLLPGRMGQCPLRPIPAGHVPCETLGVNEPAVLPKHARVHQDIPGRSVLAPEPRGVVAQRLTRAQPPQELAAGRGINMKLRHRMPDILLGGVSQHLEFGRVRPQDDAVGVDAIQSDGRGFHKGCQFLVAAAQFGFDAFALGNFGLQRGRFPLQRGDGAQLVGAKIPTETLRRQHVRVGIAHVLEELAVLRAGEGAHGIGAQHFQFLLPGDPIPQPFQFVHGRVLPALPQHGHHLAERTQPGPAFFQSIHHTGRLREEALLIQGAVRHEAAQHLRRVHDRQLPVRLQPLHVEAVRRQPFFRAGPVIFGCNDQGAFSRAESRGDELADGSDKEFLGLVELHKMSVRGGLVLSGSSGGSVARFPARMECGRRRIARRADGRFCRHSRPGVDR